MASSYRDVILTGLNADRGGANRCGVCMEVWVSVGEKVGKANGGEKKRKVGRGEVCRFGWQDLIPSPPAEPSVCPEAPHANYVCTSP